jgi:hypothetical protein
VGLAIEEDKVALKAGRKAWARLLAKVYEIDILKCPVCGGRISIITVIHDPESIRATGGRAINGARFRWL